ncbi:snRNA-activating protein complex subunit 5-like [Mizuhopecten yessoensis]|uniref:snRNA-activating protein complex subunit 5 n=1 Tax=Mizuhopecten yessoensis TaxID=6573 RepID=A0A210QLQ8_MIZYE|nr:snRNA-activating protein complex subunit 5-like [Mizuhopecten yessoensis]OWF49611.1 snRNA-activating protein complex subunit 5 [Mizuhopecten yessoensis]
MAALKELRRLRDEERTLVNIASKVSDQLNRLKVEELALVSMIRQSASQVQCTEEEENNNSNTAMGQVPHQTLKAEVDTDELYENKPTELLPLDLSVNPTGVKQLDEEEEEEDEED